MAIQSAAKAIRDTFYRRTDDIVGRSHAHGDEFEAFFVIGKESADSSKQRRILRKGADFRELMRFLEIQLTDVQWQMNNLWEEAFSTVFGVKPVRGLEIRMGKSYFDPSVDQARPYPSLDELRKWADEDLRLLKKAEKSKVRV
jgi:hypothetical protein